VRWEILTSKPNQRRIHSTKKEVNFPDAGVFARMFNVKMQGAELMKDPVDYDLPFTHRLKLLLEADIFSKLFHHEDDRPKILNKITDL
jgi:hypothetical protein